MVPVPGDGITYVSSDRGSGGENGLVVEFDRRGALAQSKHQGGPESEAFIGFLEAGARS